MTVHIIHRDLFSINLIVAVLHDTHKPPNNTVLVWERTYLFYCIEKCK